MSPTILLEETMLVNGFYFFQSFSNFLITFNQTCVCVLFFFFTSSLSNGLFLHLVFCCTSHNLTHTLAHETRSNNNCKKTRFESISNSWNDSLTNHSISFLFLLFFYFQIFAFGTIFFVKILKRKTKTVLIKYIEKK